MLPCLLLPLLLLLLCLQRFVKFDTTSEPLESLAQELGIKALPVFKFYREGKEVTEQVVGYKKKLLQDAVSGLASK